MSTTATKKHPEKIGGIFNLSWDQFKNNSGLFSIFAVITAIPSLIMSYAANLDTTNATTGFPGISIDEATKEFAVNSEAFRVGLIGFFASIVVGTVIGIIAITTLVHILKTNDQPSFSEAIRTSKKRFFAIFGVNILVSLAVTGGLILLILPGILFMFWFIYSGVVIADDTSLSLTAAMKRSKALFNANGGLPIMWGLLGFALSIAAAIISLPFVFSLNLLLPSLGDLVGNFISALVNFFYLLGFVNVYFAAKQILARQQQDA